MVYFLRSKGVYVALIMLEHFFRYRLLFPIGWRTVQIVRQHHTGGKLQIQRKPLLVQCKQQAHPLLSMHNYTPHVISRNVKNKH
jgi:hypothetical protein